MKAFVNDRYGSPDVLTLQDVDTPTLGRGGALVRVHATSVNAFDWHMLRGKPYLARLSEGFRRRRPPSAALDVAGIVEAVGANVTHIKPGDAVFGSHRGIRRVRQRHEHGADADGLTFEQAAAVPIAGQTALQGLRDNGELQAGQRVLINGAGGGVGTFAVQIAKALGADVTAVTSTKNVEMVRSIGADQSSTTPATTSPAARSATTWSSTSVARSVSVLRRVLTRTGRIVMVAPQPGQWSDSRSASRGRRASPPRSQASRPHSWHRSTGKTCSR